VGFDGDGVSDRCRLFEAKLVKAFGAFGNTAKVLMVFAAQKNGGPRSPVNAGDGKAWEERKPGPVRFRAAIIYLASQLLVASSDQPERARLRAAIYALASRRMSFCLFLLQVGFT
jgi:hypothetical protein